MGFNWIGLPVNHCWCKRRAQPGKYRVNAKINEIKNKTPNNSDLATANVLTTIKNKIPGQRKYITTPEFNNLTAENFTARLKQANLATKSDISDFVKMTDFNDKQTNLNRKVTSNKSKHVFI